MKDSNKIFDFCQQVNFDPKELAEQLKYLVEVEKKSGDQVTAILEEQSGLSLTKDEVKEFIFDHYSDKVNDFVENEQKIWNA